MEWGGNLRTLQSRKNKLKMKSNVNRDMNIRRAATKHSMSTLAEAQSRREWPAQRGEGRREDCGTAESIRSWQKYIGK